MKCGVSLPRQLRLNCQDWRWDSAGYSTSNPASLSVFCPVILQGWSQVIKVKCHSKFQNTILKTTILNINEEFESGHTTGGGHTLSTNSLNIFEVILIMITLCFSQSSGRSDHRSGTWRKHRRRVGGFLIRRSICVVRLLSLWFDRLFVFLGFPPSLLDVGFPPIC